MSVIQPSSSLSNYCFRLMYSEHFELKHTHAFVQALDRSFVRSLIRSFVHFLRRKLIRYWWVISVYFLWEPNNLMKIWNDYKINIWYTQLCNNSWQCNGNEYVDLFLFSSCVFFSIPRTLLYAASTSRKLIEILSQC